MFLIASVSGKLHFEYYTNAHQLEIDSDMVGIAPEYGGALSADLGLSGDFKRTAFLNAGIGLYRKPGSRGYEDLNYHANRVKTKASRDGQTAGYDAIFMPPKSWAIAVEYGTPEQRALVLGILKQVNANMMAYVETLACVRVTKDGVTKMISAPGGISYTTFTHEHSREADAGVHFHNVITRAVRHPVTGEPQGSGLDTQRIREEAMKIGAFTRGELVRLGQEAGLAIVIEKTSIKGGRVDYVPELALVPKALRDAHSGSAQRIERQLLSSRGKTIEEASRAETVMANRVSRPSKTLRNEHERDAAKAEALVLAKLPPDFKLKLHGASEISTHYNNASELVDAAIAHTMERTAVFADRHELAAVAAKQGNYCFLMPEIDKAIDAKLESGVLKHRYPENANTDQYFKGKGQRIANAASLTAAFVIQQEFLTDQAYADGLNCVEALADRDTVTAAIKAMEAKLGGELTQGQVDMVTCVLRSTDLIVCIEGYAGVGKTTAAEVIASLADSPDAAEYKGLHESTENLVATASTLRGACEKQGYKLLGMASSGTACGALIESGIETSTLQSAVKLGIAKKAFWSQVDSKTVLILDEASMVGTVDMNTILREVAKRRCKFIVIGDRGQMAGVERGAPAAQLFTKAEEIGNKVSLNQMKRARTEVMQDLHVASRYDPLAGVQALIDSGSLFSSRDELVRLEFIADEMSKLTREERLKVPVIVDSNRARVLVTKHLRESLGYETEMVLKGIEKHNYTRPELTNYYNYEIGDYVQFGEGFEGFKPREQVVIVERDADRFVVQHGNGHLSEFDPKWHGQKVQSAGREEAVEISVGEPIRFTGPIEVDGHKIINGTKARVDAIDKVNKKVTITVLDWDCNEKGTYVLDVGGTAPVPVRNGWAATVHSVQAASIDRGFLYSTNPSMEAFYVTMTRFRGLLKDSRWNVGIKVVCDLTTEKKRTRFKANVTRSIAPEPAMPKLLTEIGKLAPVSSFWKPESVGDLKKLEEIRVPKVLVQDDEYILGRLLEFKTKYGNKIHVTGSPEFITRAANVAAENDVGVEFTNQAGIRAVAAARTVQVPVQAEVQAAAVQVPAQAVVAPVRTTGQSASL